MPERFDGARAQPATARGDAQRWTRTSRLFDILNMPIVVLGVLFVVVAINVFLYVGYASETPPPPPAEPSTTIERPERTGPRDETLPEVTRPERTGPATTPQSTIATDRSATASATSSPSP